MSISFIDERPLKPTGLHTENEALPSLPAASAAFSAAGADQLSQLTDEASLSSLAPRLQAALADIAGPGDNVLDALGRNVENLQEGFIDALYTTLTGAGVNFSDKVTLRLGAENTLVVAGEHPQKEAIESALQEKPALSAAFGEIASQSELLRDIRNINKVMRRQSGADQYARMANGANSSVYQMSLKGEMSHFYFSRSS